MDVLTAVHSFIAPPPLSPEFQPGGRLDGLNEDLTLIAAVIALLAVVDVLLVKPFVHPKARYFALHVVANTITAVASFPDVARAWSDPLNCFTGPSATMVANSAVAAIHLYHILAFKLRGEDIFHHLTFVIVLCGLAIPYKQTGGIANNFGCFFLSGLPGGLNYVFLIAYYHGWFTRKQEKVWTARCNVWLRGPSMSVYTFLGAQALARGTYGCGNVVMLVVLGLHFTNGQHYAQQSVESLTRFREKNGGGGGDKATACQR